MKIKDTRENILEAGLKVFSSKGYRGATTREIALKAGVAEITLFRHFESKEKLFQDLLNRYSFLPALKGLLPGLKELSYRDALLVVARTFFEILMQRKELIRIIHGEILRSARPNAVFEAFIDETLRTMADCFSLYQKKGELRRFDPEIAARAFLGLFISFFLMEEVFREKSMSPKKRDGILREFVDIFIRGTETGSR
jgi:AcrR family transcriptional regulator